ncbi:hypothetical protein BHE90_014214 [Fusarium euwallaceae]|uniref:Uncharacterized protein n=1 Tax=Fusarium euwallaceae TaxID=1147111 RepID=A0A430L6L7_9HYPO|nr:hypothetical protein BHE90_014214 [Fusarium euwallaceae]
MASTAFSLEVATRRLGEDGFFDLDNSAMGEYVRQIEHRGFPFVSEYGLDFCKERVLDDERIRTIVETVLGRCTLAHWLRYKAYPGHIVCFRAGGPKAGRRALLVQLWAKGSQVKYYGGSHLHDMPKKEGARLLWENQPSALAEVGCVATKKDFPNGGVVILDSRVDYEMTEGYAITFEFATDDIIENWPKLEVPAKLGQKVASMQSETIRVNYELALE